MKRILLFTYAVSLLFFPVSLLAQGGPSIKPGQLRTQPIPLPPNQDLKGLDEKIRLQREQEAVDVKECLDFYALIKAAYNNAESSGERVLRGGQIACRLISREQEGPLGYQVERMMRKCMTTLSLSHNPYLLEGSGSDDIPLERNDIGSCPLTLSESVPFIDSGPFDPLDSDEGHRKYYLCVNPTKLDAAVEGCRLELLRYPITVLIPPPS